MNQASLAQLVEQARKGHRDAWGEIYQELAPVVYRLCRRVLPTREDAEDATMDIFLKAQLRLDQYDVERPFQPWLYRITANHCWDVLRKRRGKREMETSVMDGAGLETAEPDPQELLLAKQTHLEVREALARLGDRARLVMALRYFADLSYEEIAEVLGANSSFVGVVLLRARRQMRRLLTDKEVP